MPTSKTRVARPKSSTLAHRAEVLRIAGTPEQAAKISRRSSCWIGSSLTNRGWQEATGRRKETPEGECHLLPKPIACRHRASSSTPALGKLAHSAAQPEIGGSVFGLLSGDWQVIVPEVAVTSVDSVSPSDLKHSLLISTR